MEEQTKAEKLRIAAEARMREHASEVSSAASSSPDLQRLVYELQVHQIELEMQNEELRQAQVALEASRDRYIDLYEFSPVSYLTINTDGLIVESNLKAAKMLGVYRKDFINSRFAKFVTATDKDVWYRFALNMKGIAAGDEKEFDLSLIGKEGTTINAHLHCLRLDEEDAPEMLRIALTDVTERRRMEETLREQEAFFRIIAENSEDFIAVLDLEGRRLYNNRAYARLLGDVESLKGTDSFAEIHPDDREHIKQAFKETIQSGQGQRAEFRFLLADGTIRNIESCGGVIKDNNGNTTSVVVISHDITERIRVEREIHNLAFYDQLTHLPNRRLLNDRLTQNMATSKRSGCYCALLFLDLDNFKPLNDAHGHPVGDLLLLEVANRLKNCVREVDTVARFGGDEFIVVLSELDTDKSKSTSQALNVAEKIRTTLSEPYLLAVKRDGEPDAMVDHRCTTSIGVTLFLNHEANPDDLIKRADLLMFRAKDAGRNSVRIDEC